MYAKCERPPDGLIGLKPSFHVYVEIYPLGS